MATVYPLRIQRMHGRIENSHLRAIPAHRILRGSMLEFGWRRTRNWMDLKPIFAWSKSWLVTDGISERSAKSGVREIPWQR